MTNAADRLLYSVSQATRVGWFYSHYLLSLRLVKPLPKSREPHGPVPDRGELMRAMSDLFRQDWQNIRDGYYNLPHDLMANPVDVMRRSIAYFRDLPEVDRRRHAQINDEPFRDPRWARLPRYFRQNFHFQSGGYLTRESADLYDTQVEILFTGAADAMRRQALPPLVEYCRAQGRRDLDLLDVGCGTGRLLAFAKDNRPALRVTGVDLSQAYLLAARRNLRPFSRVRLVQGAAEALPFADASQDIVTSVFLLHELPQKIRTKAAAEFSRVLRPGGRLIVVDSFQRGDRPEWEGLLDQFPRAFHEPYFVDYARTDLNTLFASAGFRPVQSNPAFLAKVAVFDKG